MRIDPAYGVEQLGLLWGIGDGGNIKRKRRLHGKEFEGFWLGIYRM
jgi:hypothetical protein